MTRAVLLEHQEHQATVREGAGELWTDHDLVFITSIGTPIGPRSLNTPWGRHPGTSWAARSPPARPQTHTVVSLLLELGTPPHVVQAIARHADLDVTMRIYAPR
jgi:integrase